MRVLKRGCRSERLAALVRKLLVPSAALPAEASVVLLASAEGGGARHAEHRAHGVDLRAIEKLLIFSALHICDRVA